VVESSKSAPTEGAPHSLSPSPAPRARTSAHVLPRAIAGTVNAETPNSAARNPDAGPALAWTRVGFRQGRLGSIVSGAPAPAAEGDCNA